MPSRTLTDRAQIGAFCKRNHVSKLSLYGSAIHEHIGPASDVNILVEFEHGDTPGLSFFRMQAELSELLGRPVDLNTTGFLSKYYRDGVLADAEVIHAEG